MIVNFIMGFAFGMLFVLIAMLTIAWRNVQEKRRNNSETFDWDEGEYNGGDEDPEGKRKN